MMAVTASVGTSSKAVHPDEVSAASKDFALRRNVLPNPIVDHMKEKHLKHGVLIPLQTTQEVRQDHTIVDAYITRAPATSTNDVIQGLRTMYPDETANPLPHLRRCAKPADLPAHLKTHFMNETPTDRQIHASKSQWLYIILGEVKRYEKNELREILATAQKVAPAEVFLHEIPVPLLAPTSQIQAAMWSSQFWPTVYRKNNPLGPHPSIVARGTDEIRDDASLWMALAQEAASQVKKAGIGEEIGAVIVQRGDNGAELVAVAGDARWHQEGPDFEGWANPLTHCVLRAISMVAQKLVRHERRANNTLGPPPLLEYDAFQDGPLTELEKKAFEQEHPNKDGYLCHGLELFVTHEPCVQCSMSILHSRMGKCVFGKHMPRTGGMSADDRPDGGGRGLGLFWRRELNWSLMVWEWERDDVPGPAHLESGTHV